MLFKEAVDCLMKKQYVTRKAWESEIGFLVCIPGITNFLKVSLQPKPNILPWSADIESSLATDWEVKELETDFKVPPKDE